MALVLKLVACAILLVFFYTHFLNKTTIGHLRRRRLENGLIEGSGNKTSRGFSGINVPEGRLVIATLNIQKTGSTLFNAAFCEAKRIWRDENRRKFGTYSTNIHFWSWECPEGYNFCVHHGDLNHNIECLEHKYGNVIFATMLRDPVQRLISEYNHLYGRVMNSNDRGSWRSFQPVICPEKNQTNSTDQYIMTVGEDKVEAYDAMWKKFKQQLLDHDHELMQVLEDQQHFEKIKAALIKKTKEKELDQLRRRAKQKGKRLHEDRRFHQHFDSMVEQKVDTALRKKYGEIGKRLEVPLDKNYLKFGNETKELFHAWVSLGYANPANNRMTRHLAGPLECVQNFEDSKLFSQSWMVDSAIHNLETRTFFGLQDKYLESLMLIDKQVELLLSADRNLSLFPSFNTDFASKDINTQGSQRTYEIGVDTLQLIERYNRMDFALYRYAQTLFNNRLNHFNITSSTEKSLETSKKQDADPP